MADLRYPTAGESHGPALIVLIQGLPAGVDVDLAFINAELRRRQGGYGRGGRQRIETDSVEVLSGVRRGLTIGSPVALRIANKDSRMDDAERTPPVHRPRPGHADLAGSVKWLTTDCRETLERASARETAARTAAGALARCMLRPFGVEVFGFVRSVHEAVWDGEVTESNWRGLVAKRDASEVYCPDETTSERMKAAIRTAKVEQDSVGGLIEAHVFNLPLGLGTCVDWRGKLDQVRLDVPPQGQALADSLRTALAHMLISRVGPRLQPGTRSYSRSWIRDGAMISEGLLRLGRADAVRDYLEWYAPYQFDNGKVPCCVDDRGSDPVPENDSHGQLIFNIAEYWRHTGDRDFLEGMWPHVLAAYGYMEALALSERTEANRALDPAFHGMMPASISHEGYSAKPMHSYWDNFWALRGYKDAVEVARALGWEEDAARMAAARDQFRADLDASLRAAAELHGIDYLPGAAELGDFDATSTTIALAPGGEQGRLPPELLRNTFERYWRDFVARREGREEWTVYTPYEWRNVAAFVRLGWRERAWEATEYFFADRRPQAWNQWAEVVSATPREPFFLGDLPHAWVGSDFVRSALDMFAYVREVDDSIVLAAGVPAAWFDDGVSIEGLRTPQGTLGYSLRREGDALVLRVDPDAGLPEGGLVLPWPYDGEPGAATVDGEPAEWRDGELRVQSAGANVRMTIP